MALLSANGRDVLSARIVLPRVGVWWADLVVDASSGFEQGTAVTVSSADGRVSYRGTVTDQTGVYLETSAARIMGGTNGLGRDAEARYYRDVPARDVWQELLASAGETEATTVSAEVLATQLAAWSTWRTPVGAQIQRLANAIGATWRVLSDGTLWIGAEAWPTTDAPGELLEVTPTERRKLWGVETPMLVPGTSIAGDRVSRVEHYVNADEVRTMTWSEPA